MMSASGRQHSKLEGSNSDLLAHARMEGPLAKRGQKNKAWKQRHCTLADGVLSYSATASSATTKGDVPLAGCVVLSPPAPSADRPST